MPLNTLIIKLGAMGDVVRTTSLLRALSGDVYWVTKKECIPLLSFNNNFLKQVINVDYAEKKLRSLNFDLVLSLDDDFKAAKIATIVNKTTLIGSFLSHTGTVSYTDSSAEWFDMGLISKLGKQKSDELKKMNKKSYQEIVFGMAGRKFNREEYVFNFKEVARGFRKNKNITTIGIEARADSRWPTKKWNKYVQLGKTLIRNDRKVIFLKQRKTVYQYINDINKCNLIVTGDTLALHIALALKIKVAAIFTCTSPAEIYDYSRMIKVISPEIDRAFYSREYINEAVSAVSSESVYEAINKLLK